MWNKFADIFLAWLLTPLGGAILGMIIYKILLRWLADSKFYNERLIRILLTLSGIYMAFSWGANDVANATGPIVGSGVLTSGQAAIIGGAAIALGVAGWGYKVMETIGSGITNLGPLMAFAAEAAAAANVHLYTMWGIPVSTSHAIVGSRIRGWGWSTEQQPSTSEPFETSCWPGLRLPWRAVLWPM